MVTHCVKCKSHFYDAIKDGSKTFEVRRNDRCYQKGDFIELSRTVVTGFIENDEKLTRQITYVLPGGDYGIDPGYVVLGLSRD